MLGFRFAACFAFLFRGGCSPWLWQATTETTTTMGAVNGSHVLNATERTPWSFFRWEIPPTEINQSAHSDPGSGPGGWNPFGRLNTFMFYVFRISYSLQSGLCSAAESVECAFTEVMGKMNLVIEWSYWALVATTVWVLLLITRYVVIYMAVPFGTLLGEVYWYMCGQRTWADVDAARGNPVTRASWVGPEHRQQWDAQYIQQNVRGRGPDQLPLDLLISVDQSVARIRHGTVKGRTNRHGFCWKIATLNFIHVHPALCGPC